MLLKMWNKAEFQIFFGARDLNEQQRSNKKSPKTTLLLAIHRYVEFSQNVDWKTMAIILLKMKIPGFKKFSLNLVSRMAIFD